MCNFGSELNKRSLVQLCSDRLAYKCRGNPRCKEYLGNSRSSVNLTHKRKHARCTFLNLNQEKYTSSSMQSHRRILQSLMENYLFSFLKKRSKTTMNHQRTYTELNNKDFFLSCQYFHYFFIKKYAFVATYSICSIRSLPKKLKQFQTENIQNLIRICTCLDKCTAFVQRNKLLATYSIQSFKFSWNNFGPKMYLYSPKSYIQSSLIRIFSLASTQQNNAVLAIQQHILAPFYKQYTFFTTKTTLIKKWLFFLLPKQSYSKLNNKDLYLPC